MPTYVRSSGQWLPVSGSNVSGTVFASGTTLLFYQASAPTGWSQVVTHNDKALRVVSGTGGGSGGSTAFTTVFTSKTPTGTVDNTTLSASQLGNHTHAYTAPSSYTTNLVAFGANNYKTFPNVPGPSGVGANTGGINEGSGGAHNHGFTATAMDFAVQYINIILCAKT
jgi:hypothetical protein